MCDPITATALLSAGLSAGGAASNFMAGERANKAIEAAYAKERRERSALEGGSREAFNISLGGVNPSAITAAKNSRKQAFTQASAPVSAGSFSPVAGASPVAARAIANAVGGINREAARTAEGQAGLDSVGDFINDRAISHGRTMETIGTNNDFIRGNQSILGLQVGAADAKRKDPLGDALMLAGQVVGALGPIAGPGVATKPPTNIVPKSMSSFILPPGASTAYSGLTLGGLY